MTAPLTSLECELLEAVAHGRDEHAIAVLGDYWIERVDEARGAFVQLGVGANAGQIELAGEEARLGAFAARWRWPLLSFGWAERDLVMCDGFLQWPLAVSEGHVLDGHAALVRISPRYYRERALVRGGVECDVYEAQAITPRTITRVAIKAPREPELGDLIDHEYEIMSQIAHPNIARVLGYAIRPAGRALALEWCGIDLRRLLASAREHGRLLGTGFAVSVAVQLLDGLVALHAAGIRHCEIRSDHVTLTADGTVKVVDFGCARWDRARSRFSRNARRISPGYPGDMSYRLRYMSPEQCRGRVLDDRSDVYSAAGLICELVANRHPSEVRHHATDFALLQFLVYEQLSPPAELPARLRLPFAMALDRDPRQRLSAAALRDTLVAAARMMRLEIGPHVIARRLVELGVPA